MPSGVVLSQFQRLWRDPLSGLRRPQSALGLRFLGESDWQMWLSGAVFQGDFSSEWVSLSQAQLFVECSRFQAEYFTGSILKSPQRILKVNSAHFILQMRKLSVERNGEVTQVCSEWEAGV